MICGGLKRDFWQAGLPNLSELEIKVVTMYVFMYPKERPRCLTFSAIPTLSAMFVFIFNNVFVKNVYFV